MSRYFVALVILFSFAARADILFMDLNNSKREEAAARRAAEIRGERLIVLPRMEKEWQDKMDSSRKIVATADVMRGRTCRGDAAGSTNCLEAKATYQKVFSAHEKLEKIVPKWDGAKLSSEFAKLKEQNVNLSSVIVSGHDGDREFWGVTADLKEADIENAFIANKPLGDNVRSMYLWSCYAATTDDFIKSWKKAFPQTLMVAGFGGQAPLGSRPASGNVLEDLLVKEAALTGTRDKTEIKNIFDSLNDINKVNANICVDRETIVSKKGVRTVQDEIEACKKPNPVEQKHVAIFNCYLNAEPGCEDIPDDDEKGPLRKAYDYFQEFRHCEQVLAEMGISKPVPQLLARTLLFDRQVRRVFERIHKKELAAFNALLDKLGYPAWMRMKDLGGLKRGQYLNLLKGIERHWVAQMDATKDENGFTRDPEVLAVGKYIAEAQKLDKTGCVPLSWVEEGETPRDSECGIRSGMQTALSRSRAEVGRLAPAPIAPSPSLLPDLFSEPSPSGSRAPRPRASGLFDAD